MVKIYYEEALRTKQGKAESDEDGKDVADTKPQPDAEDMEDDIVESPKKRMKIEKEEAMKEDSNSNDNYRRCKGGTRLQIKDGQEQSEDHDEDYDVLIRGVNVGIEF